MKRLKMSARTLFSRVKRRVSGKNKAKLPVSVPQEPADCNAIRRTTATSQGPGHCHFLRLPTELRLIIYEFAFCDYNPNPNPTVPRNTETYLFDARITSAPLIQTCRLVRREAVRYYCRRLRDVAVDLRKSQIIAYMGVFWHRQITEICFQRQHYDWAFELYEAYLTRWDATGIVARYTSSMKIGVTNRVDVLATQGYDTGLGDAGLGLEFDDIMEYFEEELKEMLGITW